MEFIDLKRQYLSIEDKIKARIQGVLDHGKYIMGPEVDELERRLACYAGVKHCISCANGTDALQMVLMAWGIGPGDAVFVPTFTFMSTAEVVSIVGAVPIFIDCELDTFNLDPMHLRESIQRIANHGELIPKAIIAVDLFGQLADYDRIQSISDEFGLHLLEDAAQSFGASYNGKRAGSYGHAATTSFFPAKPLGCYGDGGAIFTDDDNLAEVLKSIRVHGQGTDKYDNIRIGLNGRLDTLQAAILLVKLDIFQEELLERQRVALNYQAALESIVDMQRQMSGSKSAWAQFSIMTDGVEHRSTIMEALKKHGIPSMIYYRKPLHCQDAFKQFNKYQTVCQASETVASRILSLPMHPYLSQDEIIDISNVISQLPRV